LLKDFFTIVIIPRRTTGVRRIRIPVVLFAVAVVLVTALIIAWGYLLAAYFSTRKQLSGFETLIQREAKQREEIRDLFREIETVDVHFENLDTLNQKLRQMTREGVERKPDIAATDRQHWKQKALQAQKEGILSVIASDTTEIDSDLKSEQESRFENLVRFYTDQNNPLNRLPDRIPVKGYPINQYGDSRDSYSGESQPLDAINLITRNFQPVYAPADGVVISLISQEDLGNVATIDHGNGFLTRFGHLARFEINEGDFVKRGKLIAQAGNTGHTTGPRLYYQVIFHGVPLNPHQTVSRE